jgi:hypothetical protein
VARTAARTGGDPVRALAGAALGRARPTVVAAIAAAAPFVVAPSPLWSQQKPLLGAPSIFTAT